MYLRCPNSSRRLREDAETRKKSHKVSNTGQETGYIEASIAWIGEVLELQPQVID